MTKGKILIALLAGFILLSATTTMTEPGLREKLIGTWNWETVINSTTNEDMGLGAITMGMATKVKTEFINDNTYLESKWREGSAEFSTTRGEWKLEDDVVLSLKAKDKWKPSKILKLSNDTLLLEMNPQMHLLMIREE